MKPIRLSECASRSARSIGGSPWIDGFTAGPVRPTAQLRIVDVETHRRIDRGESRLIQVTSRFAEGKTQRASQLAWQTQRVLNATESLERSRRARLDRVVDSWEASPSSFPHSERVNTFQRFLGWLLRRQRPVAEVLYFYHRRERRALVEFETYLVDAHLHQAIARRSARGSRRWFEDWRQHALAALRLGISPRELVELLRSAPVAASVRRAPTKPARRQDADVAGFRERLENVIFPNAPGAAGAFRALTTGDGLATAPI